MKLKRTDHSLEADNLRAIKRKVEQLSQSIESIMDNHDCYSFKSDREASDWFNSFPIESLNDSLLIDNKLPKAKLSLVDFKNKSILRRKYYNTSDNLDIAMCELNIANIDFIISKIKEIIE